MEDFAGRAGAMSARGRFEVGDDLAIAGSVRVELGMQSVQAPVTLRMQGTALDPRFAR